jgi:hypothetical protein
MPGKHINVAHRNSDGKAYENLKKFLRVHERNEPTEEYVRETEDKLEKK